MSSQYEHERDIKPVNVWYECEFCHEGEQQYTPEAVSTWPESNMFRHKCTKCGKEMLLPKAYPFIKWIPVTDDLK